MPYNISLNDRVQVERATELNAIQSGIVSAKNALQTLKTDAENLKVTVDADPESLQEDKDLMQQAENLVNNATYTGFLTFITNALG